MKLGVSMWSVVHEYQKGNMDGERFINLMHDHSVQGVELLDFFWKDKETELPRAVDKIKQYHMEVACYSIGNDFVASCPEEREKQMEYVREGIDDAVKIGANKLRVFSGNPKEGITYEQGREWIIDCFREVVKYAEQKDIILVLENHGLFAGKSTQVKEIIEKVASPNLRAAADTGNFLLVGEKPEEAVRNLEGYISHVHFKDFKRAEAGKGYKGVDDLYYEGCILGEGEVDLEKIVEILKEANYEDYLTIEYEGEDPQIEGTVKSIEYVRQLWGGINS